jgi:hypothetical protein
LSQKPGSCISPSSRAICCSSEAGSKIVREQLELVAEARDAGIELLGLYLLRHSLVRVGDGIERVIGAMGKRAVWTLGKVEVYDGGSDGDADTAGDDTLFMEQGLFVP